MRLDNKVALVTGGAIRVGKVISKALAEAGADLVISYWGTRAEAEQTQGEIQAMGRRCMIYEANMRDIPQLRSMVEETDRQFGRLDILIHNASNFNEGPMSQVTEEIWDSSHEIILKGAFFLSQAAAPLMMKHKSGRVLAMIGDSYYENWPLYIPHSIAKVGLVKLMECLAVELSPYIQCSALCPATIMTSAVGGYSPALKARAEICEESRTMKINDREIVMGNPEQVAELIVYLCSCSNYMNGAVIPIDGGKHLL